MIRSMARMTARPDPPGRATRPSAASSPSRGRASAGGRARRAGSRASCGRRAIRPLPTPAPALPGEPGRAAHRRGGRSSPPGPIAVHPVQPAARGHVDRDLLARVGHLDDGEHMRCGGARLEDGGDRGQRGLVAAQKQPVDVVARDVVDAGARVADAAAERELGRPRACRAGRLVQHDVDVDGALLGVVPAHRVVAPLLRGRARWEGPASGREHDPLAGRSEQQGDDLSRLLDRPACAEPVATKGHAHHPRRQQRAGRERGDAGAPREAISRAAIY